MVNDFTEEQLKEMLNKKISDNKKIPNIEPQENPDIHKECLPKKICAMEVFNELKKINLISIIMIISSFACAAAYKMNVFVGGIFIIATAGAGIYFFYTTKKKMDYLKGAYQFETKKGLI